MIHTDAFLNDEFHNMPIEFDGCSIVHELTRSEINAFLRNRIWITRDGRKIYVHLMESSHIENCIKCFNGLGSCLIPEDYLGGKVKWLKIFNQELAKRSL